jgi:hypothetical protein
MHRIRGLPLALIAIPTRRVNLRSSGSSESGHDHPDAVHGQSVPRGTILGRAAEGQLR